MCSVYESYTLVSIGNSHNSMWNKDDKVGNKTENRKLKEKALIVSKLPVLAIPMLINRKPVQKRGIRGNAVFPLLAFKGLLSG